MKPAATFPVRSIDAATGIYAAALKAQVIDVSLGATTLQTPGGTVIRLEEIPDSDVLELKVDSVERVWNELYAATSHGFGHLITDKPSGTRDFVLWQDGQGNRIRFSPRGTANRPDGDER